ncbi:hypothetical protein EV189_3657 [Motilibacter rhizosphaerae]|uniref:YCII-related domain-containing protein n=1 Tax=Motilibacter rhizosphaerae TaxID=598652 RepID=A0A4Q7NB68_9ACTN|nr:YciI family protein [Motilibacter rhizosphaerae]RZS80176.1 hypothetical protein EV189_3657 [Motilibacter rhizosphaerae]
MKYLVLIHSAPSPWGHPTVDFTPEGRAQSPEQRAAGAAAFDELLREISASGELVTAEALGAPASSTVYRWQDGAHVVSEGPYAESKEHLAGFFLLDCATRERAEALAARFAGPGDTIELRPAMWGD